MQEATGGEKCFHINNFIDEPGQAGLTLELEKRRPTPSMQTCRRPPSPDWMSCTGNSPPSSMPGATPPTPLAAALSMAALMQ